VPLRNYTLTPKVNHFRFGTFWPFRVTGGHQRCQQTIFRIGFPVRYDEKTPLIWKKWVYRWQCQDFVVFTAALNVLNVADCTLLQRRCAKLHRRDIDSLQRRRNVVSSLKTSQSYLICMHPGRDSPTPTPITLIKCSALWSGEKYLIFMLLKVRKWTVISPAKNYQNSLKTFFPTATETA